MRGREQQQRGDGQSARRRGRGCPTANDVGHADGDRRRRAQVAAARRPCHQIWRDAPPTVSASARSKLLTPPASGEDIDGDARRELGGIGRRIENLDQRQIVARRSRICSFERLADRMVV